ncbi:substrate-binding periplasmic protein [Desulfonatronum lacustre]|uniref:substrate-binding periplasmic protein n=1 Tax=Desulfonatronum lacustre TaxID=66849 RepID=UPI00048FACF0|nr:ABC transporter substrate-binding protein [Desulfonatronum lacustre]
MPTQIMPASRKFTWKGLAIALLFLLLCPLPSVSSAQARGLEEIRESGELRACIVPATPAYVTFADPACLEDCRVSGPVPRVVEAVAAALGSDVRPIFHRLEWDEQFHNAEGRTALEAEYTPYHLETGRCDVYPTHLTKNEWRLKKLDFAILFLNRIMVIVHQDRLPEFTSMDDLAGKTAGVALNTSLHTWVLEQNQEAFRDDPIQIRLIDFGAELGSVESGLADFTLLDAEVSLWESVNRFQDLNVAFPVGPMEEIGWAFSRQNQDLRDVVQAFFTEQVRTETSALNSIWKEEYGLTLSQFRALIQATQ